MRQRGIAGSDDRSRVSEVKPEDASRIAGAVHQAIAETFNPSPRTPPPGFPVQYFMQTLLAAADELGVELSREEILKILEMALRRHASIVIGDQVREVVGEPFKLHGSFDAQLATP
ncbi:MAG: hypothetical protein OXI39_14900 [Gemmatimonadota bacterium]|uniref:hypothetical protein n=1 Tax=Candidatus Palauibacter scopulicola TaxID=3056741 RepID=UPI0023840B5D|nr:hypothetical protein [Candidatus Palauibacter scopulicola]MDE2664273.1 hypothetical protein [Candidatus Palauibacter scopulicola]